MNTTTTTAAHEAAKNLKIYGLMAEVARKAFEFLTIAPGEYTAAQVVTALKKSRAQWTDDAPGVADPDGLAAIACDDFECKYPLQMAFEVLAQVATAYDIPTAERVTFERAAEAAPVLLTLNVPTAAKEVAKAVSKKDTGTPALTFAYYDAERRALVGTNRQILTVVAAPFAEVAPEAADRKGFFVPVALLRSNRVTIDTNNNATDGHKVAESPDWLRFPNWVTIFPQVHDTDALTLDKATARKLTKAVATATKFAAAESGPSGLTKYVAIFGEAYTDRLTVRARHFVGDHYEYNDTTVNLPATLSRSFSLAVSGDDFAALPTFDTIFVPAHHRPAIVKSAHAVALIFALTLPEGFEAICDTDTPPTWAKVVDPLAEVLDVFKPCPLTADTIESEPQADTIPAAAETPVEVATAETPAAPTGETVESVESVAPDTIKADTCESHSEAENVAPVLFTADGDTFRRGDRVIMTYLYYSDRAEVVGTLTDKERGGSTAEVTDDTGRKFYGWYAGVKHATAETIAEAVEVAPVWASVYAIACELPNADGIESEPTPQAETLTPPPADTIESEGEPVAPVLTIERPRHHWHRRAVRVALRVAALIAAALLLILTPDRVETIEAEPLAPQGETIAPAEIADTLTADTIEGEAVEIVESVAPAEIKARARESHSEPRKHATGHRPDRLAPVAPADTIEADTIAAPADLLTIAPAEIADTLTADTIGGEAVEVAESAEGEPQGDTLTTGTPETIEATGEAVESVESPEGDPATTGTTGTPSPTSTPATGCTPSPAAVGTVAPVPAAVALALLLML